MLILLQRPIRREQRSLLQVKHPSILVSFCSRPHWGWNCPQVRRDHITAIGADLDGQGVASGKTSEMPSENAREVLLPSSGGGGKA